MRFIGSKQNLLPLLSSLVAERAAGGGVFCDMFAGTAVVGSQFKKAGFSVMSTDLLYFSYILQKVRLELNHLPDFSKLLPHLGKAGEEGIFNGDRAGAVIAFLNRMEGEDGFIFRHYTPEGGRGERYVRRYFSAENGRKIDAIRGAIERWKDEGWINQDEYCLLLCSLIEAVPSVSNISGTYAAFLKNWDARALKPLRLAVPEVTYSIHKHVAANEDAADFAARVKGASILYLDPPYNARQYAPNYHILETIARGDSPEVRGVSGMRNYEGQKSAFCSRAKALAALAQVLETASYRHLMLSYNNEGYFKARRDIVFAEASRQDRNCGKGLRPIQKQQRRIRTRISQGTRVLRQTRASA